MVEDFCRKGRSARDMLRLWLPGMPEKILPDHRMNSDKG
jgi:hypothetical protein